MTPLVPIAAVALVPAIGVYVQERRATYEAARAQADALGLPLLNIGCPRTYFDGYPCGEVCLDIDPARLRACQSPEPRVADIRAIPYPAGTFGAACCSHVLEHMHTVADAERALAELQRVSGGRVFACSPKRWSLPGIFHPDHHLWVDHLPDGSIRFEQRYRGVENGEAIYPLMLAWQAASDALIRAITSTNDEGAA